MKIFYHFSILFLAIVFFTPRAFAQPANSSCGTSQALAVGVGTCSSPLYTNVGAPTAGLPSVPACWSPATASNTVWFSFVATFADVEISTNFAGTLANTQVAVYAGACGSLVQIGCQEDINTAGGLYHTDIILHGLTVGNTYHIAVDGNGNTTGTFGVCVQQAAPVAPPGPTQDCETAKALCNTANQVIPNGPGGVGSVQTNPSCFGAPGERSSTWYTFTAATSGVLAFTITPNTSIDYDFAVYNSTLSCPGVELSCNWSGTLSVTGLGCAGVQCNPTINLVAGQTYSILVDRYTATSTSGATISFAGTTATFGPPVPAFTASTVCVGAATTFTNNTPGNNTYSWNFGDTYTSNATNPTHTYAAAGTYNVSLLITTVPGGCQNSITKVVTVKAKPTVTVSSNSPVCTGANAVFTLTGTPGAIVTYNINGGTSQTVSLSAAGSGTVTVNAVTATTTLNVTLTTGPGTPACTSNISQSSTVTISSPSAPGVTSPVSYCQNAPAVPLTATGTGLLWYTTATGGIGSSTAPTPATATPGSTTYYVSQTVSGCVSPRAAITVNVTAMPAAPTVTSPVTYCENEMAAPLAATGTNLLWYTVASGGTGSGTAPTPSTTTPGSITYYVSQTIATCESPRASIMVTVNAMPAVPTVTSPVTYCENETATPLTATGSNLLWYTIASGGTGSVTAPTPSTTTAGSTTYYVSQTIATCESPRASITVTVNAMPAAPAVTSPVTYCENETATPLTATGSNLLWYTAATGGTGSAIAPTPSTTTAGSTTYYVSQTIATCESPRSAITVTVNAAPAIPTVTSPVIYCQNAPASTLSASGTNLLWYTVPTGGTGTATAPIPSTATAGSTTYYVSQTIATCESPRASITVNVSATPAAPTVTSPVTYCQNATAAPLSATGTNLLWYTAATGGTGSPTAPTPSTATAGSTTFYVSQTISGCESPRALITVNLTATPAAPSVTSPVVYCQNATAAPLSATGTNLLWYTAATGGTGSATAPTPSTTIAGSTTYYVSQTVSSCESPRVSITVNVTATPAAPTVISPVTYCQNATATPLTATGTNLLWYTAATGGTGTATAPTPSTTTAGSTTYYVSQTIATCESPRASITVNVTATPAAPTVTSPVTYCQNATATPLTATGTNLLWYTTATGGTGSSTAPTPSTSTAGSTTYYVSQTIATCESPRASIIVNVTATPFAPTVTSPVTYCQNATAMPLTATGTNLLWYTAATGGTGTATAPTPSTSTAGSTTYYVSQTIATCESPRASITVIVNATPAAPTVTSPVTYCQNATAMPLTATGTNLLWYTAATGGTGTATAPTPSTSTAGSTTYYVSQTIATCESPRASITVIVNATPAAPTVTSPVTYCQNATATPLTATGTNVLWYLAATGGTGTATAPTPSTATPGSITYYVSQTIVTCESPRASITVNVSATPAAPTVTSPVTYCQNATAMPLTATGTNLLWYTAATGGTGSSTAPTPSTSTAGSTTYYVSQTIATCESPRASIIVNVTATPFAPTVTSPVTYCQNATAMPLTATGTNLLWYTAATGGTGSSTAPTPSTTIAGSTIYYVSQTISTCESPRASITVNVSATPAAPTVTSPVTYCQNATATPLSASGTNLLWYAAATGGTGSATAPTPSTSTAGSTTYYVSQTIATCESPRASITVNVSATPAAPTVTSPVTYCQNATATPLTATGTNLLWYTAATGGTGTATAPTPSTTTAGSTTYYVSQAISGCESPRASITVNVTATPAAPTVMSPVTYCQNATAAPLTATGTNLLWYTAATGGTGSATAPTPSTATAGSTTYYVSQTIATCESPRASITVNVTATPAAPTVTSPVTYCQNATATPLTATGNNLLWYTAATGGTGSSTAPTPSTTIAGSTIYYVSQTISTCESPRASITVNVSATPAAPTVTSPVTYCQNATATPLSASGTNLLWYAAATGGTGSATAPTPSTSTAGSTTYYVSQTIATCESPRASITVNVSATPAAPTVTSPVTYCQNATATPLTATGTNLLWYTAATGGTGTATAPTPSTTTAGSTTYYVSQAISGCESPRASITVNVTATPAAPTVMSPVTYCQNATAAPLTATGTNLLWYTAATGGTGSATAPTPSTATAGSTTYYVSQTIATCESPRASITVNVTATPAAPTVTSPVTYCQNATATPLTATGNNLLWYTAATGGTGSSTAPTPSTTIAGSTIYYVSQTISTCESPRASITVNVSATPAAPTVTSPVTYCQNATATPLSASGTNLLWYAAATGGTGSATAPTPSTSTAGSTTYYVSQTIATCESPRASITVNVSATPAAPTVTSPVTYCQNATATPLTATGTNLLWYTAATGGTGTATAPTPSTTTAGSTTYYVSQAISGCESPRASITVNVTATPAAPTVMSPVTYCQNATAAPLTATGTNLLWYTAATGGTGSATAPTPSTATAGSTTYYVSQTIATCESPRASITVNVTATPAAPTVTSPVTYCQNATATPLTATGNNLLWYTAATGGTGSSTAPTPSTTIAGSTIYYVSQTISTCESPRASITVNVTATPAAPIVTSPITYCQNATAAPLTATGTNLLWYTAATGGTGSSTAPTPSTATAGPTTYYVSQTIATCESPRASITVNVTALPAAPTVTSPVTYCQNASAAPLTATGTNLLWYTAPTGGLGSATAPTPSTATAGSTTYYVSQTVSSCESPRASIIVTINATPAAPTVTSPVTYCQNATATPLSATGTNLLWYTAATGGTGTATAPTPSTTTAGSTTYYVSQTLATCESPRASIIVNVTATPAAPSVTSLVTYCQNATATPLSATGTNLLWYVAATGGTGSATAPTPSTATAGSTTYYVSQTISGCESPRASITVNVTATPAAPTVTSPVTYCQNATAAPLTATGTNLLWYVAATGGTGSATAPTPSTTTAGSTTYYVSQTIATCESQRASITVNVSATPAAPTVTSPVTYCQNATATPLTATGTNLLWYVAATGGTGSSTAPTPSTTTAGSTTYYVSQTIATCESPRASITVTVNAMPVAPTVTSPVTYCQNAAVVPLAATGTNLLWYTVATGGTGSATAPTPSTITAGSTTYYVSQTIATCESPRASITVNVSATPAAPTVTSPVTYCQNATAAPLLATGTNLLWYTTATGGTGSATAPTPSTITAGSTIYYVSQTISSCESPRALITVNVTATPAAPAVISPVTYCQNATAAPVSATGTNLLWYTAALGGTGSSTAPTPSTTTAGSTTYYVSQTIATCQSPRASITVNVTATPAAPIVTTPVTYCQNATAAPLSATGTNLLWYTTATGGTGSATAPTPSTATVNSTTYYVSQTIATCESPRASITVNVSATPTAPAITSPVTYCQNATATPLTATGTNLLWYTAATGGTGSATAPTPSTTTAGSTTYYVSQTIATCESPRASITVNVTATPAAPTVTSPVTYCQNATATPLTATGTNLLWYTAPTGGTGSSTAPTPSTTTAGSTTYYVSQTIATCESPRASITVNVTATPAAPTVTSPITYCQNTTAVPLTATGTNLLWYTSATGGTGSATAPTPSTTTAGSTTYYVSKTIATCESPRASITVNVTATPAVPVVITPVTYCQNATAAPLTATGTNLLWYTAATGGTGIATAPTPSTATAGSTPYYVSQTISGCESPRTSIVVNVNPLPAAPAVVSPLEYCRNAVAAPLTASGTNLLWYASATGGVGSSAAPTPSTAVAGSVTNYYVSQTVNGCEGPRSVITVNVDNLIVNIGNDTTICQGDSVKFSPVVTPAASSYAWRSITAGVSNSTISNLNTLSTTVRPVDTAEYVLRATLGQCSIEDTVKVNVRWKPIVDAGPNKPICLNDSVFLSGTVTHTSPANPILAFSWTPAASVTTPNAPQTWAHPLVSTWYTLTVTTTVADYGCAFTVSDSVKVIVQPAVRAFAGNDTIAVKNTPHQLHGTGGTKYMWSSPTAIISNPLSQNPTTTLSNDANIYLRVEDAIGCFGLDSVFIKVYEGPNYYVPNAFSPNGDGLNDVFRVIPVGIANTTYMRVFNRYGQLVFETNQWLKGWDGTYKGKLAQEGAYVWMVKGEDKNRRPIEMKGTVMLIR